MKIQIKKKRRQTGQGMFGELSKQQRLNKGPEKRLGNSLSKGKALETKKKEGKETKEDKEKKQERTDTPKTKRKGDN